METPGGGLSCHWRSGTRITPSLPSSLCGSGGARQGYPSALRGLDPRHALPRISIYGSDGGLFVSAEAVRHSPGIFGGRLTTASASAMAARSRSSVSGMPSPSLGLRRRRRLHDFEQLRLGVGEVLLRADA